MDGDAPHVWQPCPCPCPCPCARACAVVAGIVTDLPPMSEKDRADIAFGVEHDIDMVAASFVRNAEGVREIRGYLQECHE
eukprot:4801532-Prymnesium_polylepis.1